MKTPRKMIPGLDGPIDPEALTPEDLELGMMVLAAFRPDLVREPSPKATDGQTPSTAPITEPDWSEYEPALAKQMRFHWMVKNDPERLRAEIEAMPPGPPNEFLRSLPRAENSSDQ